MKITAVTAEFNPLHKGHLIPLNYAKNTLKSDYVIAIISPSFVQRGECAFFSKQFRTKCALECGYDAVIELPLLGALSSAEGFAKSSIDIMNASGIISSIVFGSEFDSKDLLEKTARATLLETTEAKSKFKELMSQGLSYPKAMSTYLLNEGIISNEESKIIEEPNSILSLEYIKALLRTNSEIEFHPIKREKGSYHSSTHALSAEYIRNNYTQDIAELIPEQIREEVLKEVSEGRFLKQSDFDSIIHYSLISYFSKHEPENDTENRIKNKLYDFTTTDSFILDIKTKNQTYSSIARRLLNIALNPDGIEYERCNFIRVLGFRKESSKIITELKKCSKVPVILNPAKDLADLKGSDLEEFKRRLLSDDIWKAALTDKLKQPFPNEYSFKYPIKY